MDDEVKKEEDDERYARERREREERDREATGKKRLKRMKKSQTGKGRKDSVQTTGAGGEDKVSEAGHVKTGMEARVDGALAANTAADGAKEDESAAIVEAKEEQGLIICDDD